VGAGEAIRRRRVPERTGVPVSAAPRPAGAPPPITPEERALLSRIPERMDRLREALSKRVIGQERTVRELLLSFVAGGHALVVGVPGLAKTLLIRSLAELLDLSFARIQFTPDLMPSDITGTSMLIENETTRQREFRFRPGPLFTNLLLADEINRTPPKTQAALLEAMEEGQVTTMGEGHRIAPPFYVLATQNPLEQEGTYPLPVTQLDRFLFQILIDYPDAETEFDVIARTTALAETPLSPVLAREELMGLLALPRKVEVPEGIAQRAVNLGRATRPAERDAPSATRELLSWGAGPRGVQAILAAARAAAVLAGRDRVELSDYEEVVTPALRHRILLGYHAEAERITPDAALRKIREEIGDWRGAAESAEPEAPPFWQRWLRSAIDTTPPFRSR